MFVRSDNIRLFLLLFLIIIEPGSVQFYNHFKTFSNLRTILFLCKMAGDKKFYENFVDIALPESRGTLTSCLSARTHKKKITIVKNPDCVIIISEL